MIEKKPNAKALAPIIVFLLFYLGSGIYFEYINPKEGQMGFYVMSVVAGPRFEGGGARREREAGREERAEAALLFSTEIKSKTKRESRKHSA